MTRIEAGLAAIAERLERDAERAEFRERVIDRLHGEVDRLRALERGGVLRPVVIDLCRLRNDMMRQARTLPQEMTTAKAGALLTTFAGAVEDALDRCGVVVARPVGGSPFSAGHHQVARTVEVTDPALDGTVAEVVQDGYVEVDGEKVVVPARVAVYRATAGPAQEDTSTRAGDAPGPDTAEDTKDE